MPENTELGVQPSTFIRGSRQPNSWTWEPARAPSSRPTLPPAQQVGGVPVPQSLSVPRCPAGGLAMSPAHGSPHSVGPHCPQELTLPPLVAKGGEDRFPISLPRLQTLPGLPQHCKDRDRPAQLSPLLWCPLALGLGLGLARPGALALQAGACLTYVPRRGCPPLWSSTCPALRDL